MYIKIVFVAKLPRLNSVDYFLRSDFPNRNSIRNYLMRSGTWLSNLPRRQLRDVLSNMQALRNFYRTTTVFHRNRERERERGLSGARDYRVSHGNGTVRRGSRKSLARDLSSFIRPPARSCQRSDAHGKLCQKYGPSTYYLRTPIYARAYYPAVCIGIWP